MKILFVSNLLPPDFEGGLEINALKVANGLRARGHDVEVVTSRLRPEYDGPPEDREWVHRILTLRRIWHIPERVGNRNKWDMVKRQFLYEQTFIANYRALSKFLKGRSYDVAYVWGLAMVGPSLVMALTEAGIPCLYHLGDTYLGLHWQEYDRSRLYRLMYSTVLREVKRTEHGADRRHLAFVSKSLANEVSALGLPFDNAYIIPRGIEFALATDVERTREWPPVIIMGGRISPDKGYHIAMDAFGRLHREDPERPWVVHVYGHYSEHDHPTYLTDLKSILLRYDAEHRVVWKGQVPRQEILEKYRTASLFLSSATYAEPFGNTIIESLAMGTPMIGSRIGAMEEIVVDGVHALLYDANDPNDLVRQVRVALDDWTASLQRARAGLRLIEEKYRMDTILTETEKVLESVARSNLKQAT